MLALPGLLVGGAVGGAGAWLVHETDPAGHAPLLWAVAVVAGGCAWLVPSSRDARDGARLVLRGARHEGRVALLLVALAALALLVAWYAAAPGGVPRWWPLPVAGWWMG